METGKHGFTLMEVFIVALVLCVITAIAIPRVSHARSEARLSDMVGKLQNVRSQLSLYKVQHDGLLPGQKRAGGDVGQAGFVHDLTTASDDGLGPYLNAMPKNFFVETDAADDITCVNDSNAVPTGNEGTGWWLNAATGEFRACDNEFHSKY